MEFLGIGPLELLLVILLALILFSPKDIAGGGKKVGRMINSLYRSDTWKTMRKMSQEIQDLPNQLAREAQLEEMKEISKTLNRDIHHLQSELPPADSSTPTGNEAAATPPKANSETSNPPGYPTSPA